jgi:hypothetical protein
LSVVSRQSFRDLSFGMDAFVVPQAARGCKDAAPISI